MTLEYDKLHDVNAEKRIAPVNSRLKGRMTAPEEL